MTPKQRNDLRELAATKHKGNLEAAACEFIDVLKEFKGLGNKVPNGNVGAVLNIVDELEKYAELDATEAAERDPVAGRSDEGESTDDGSGEA